jgi:hypothetical protein
MSTSQTPPLPFFPLDPIFNMAFQLSSQTNDIKNFAASLPVLLVLISSASTEDFSMKGGF